MLLLESHADEGDALGAAGRGRVKHAHLAKAGLEVAGRARFVRVDEEGVERVADSMPEELTSAEADDPAHLELPDPADTLAYVITLDAVSIVSTAGLSVSPAEAGLVTIVDSELVFDPSTEFDELDTSDLATVSIAYTMSDDSGATSSSTVLITVAGENDGPVAVGKRTVDLDTTVHGSWMHDDRVRFGNPHALLGQSVATKVFLWIGNFTELREPFFLNPQRHDDVDALNAAIELRTLLRSFNLIVR